MNFVRSNMDQIAKKITDDLFVLSVMEVCSNEKPSIWSTLLTPFLFCSPSVHIQRWYAEQVQLMCTWLTDRLDRSLHPYQCTCLAFIVKVKKPCLLSCSIYWIILVLFYVCFTLAFLQFPFSASASSFSPRDFPSAFW